MLCLGLEVIILVSTINHNGESTIDSSRRYPIIFLYLGLKFPSDSEDFLVELYFVKPGDLWVIQKRRNSVGVIK